MSTNDPNWSDDGFDSLDDGFMPRQTKAAEPVSAFQRPVPPPPAAAPSRTSSPRRAVIFLLLFFITAIGLVITWVSRGPEDVGPKVQPNVTTESQQPEQPEQQQEPSTEPVNQPQPEPEEIAPEPKRQLAKQEPPTAVDSKPDKPREIAEATKPAVRVPEPAKAAPKETTRRQDAPMTRTSPNTKQEWCVQVFASTNPDDADEWNNRLKSKNIDDSRIEMVDRQGQLWYRVRFGRFSTKQEAEQIAQQMGFRNAWVNRAR